MIFCMYFFNNIWLNASQNAYKDLETKENKNQVFNFYNCLKMKVVLGHVLITPFSQIFLIIISSQVHILHDEHFI